MMKVRAMMKRWVQTKMQRVKVRRLLGERRVSTPVCKTAMQAWMGATETRVLVPSWGPQCRMQCKIFPLAGFIYFLSRRGGMISRLSIASGLRIFKGRYDVDGCRCIYSVH